MRNFHHLVVFILVFAIVGSTVLAMENPYVLLQVSAYTLDGPVPYGSIVLELYPDKAPVTVDNFLGYVNSGFYDNILFHRAIPNFMIQAGLCYPGLEYPIIATPGDPIINESDNGLSNVRGTISTALSDYADSATSQFFINQVDNTRLDYPNVYGYGHCVFGAVVQGMNIVDAIAQSPTNDYSDYWGGAFQNFPDNPMIGIGATAVHSCNWSYCMDFTGNGRIGLEDFAIISSHWLDDDCHSANGFCDGADLDYNGTVDVADLDFFVYQWMQVAGNEWYNSDLAYDGKINIDDVTALMSYWLDSGCSEDNGYCYGADIDHNGTVDMVDYYLLSSHWLEDYTTP